MDDDSKFNKDLDSIRSDFNAHYKLCNNSVTDFCSFRELAINQWLDNKIIGNLPHKYFPKRSNGAKSIVEFFPDLAEKYYPELSYFVYRSGLPAMPGSISYDTWWDSLTESNLYNAKYITDIILNATPKS